MTERQKDRMIERRKDGRMGILKYVNTEKTKKKKDKKTKRTQVQKNILDLLFICLVQKGYYLNIHFCI